MTDAIQLNQLPLPDVVESLDYEAILAMAENRMTQLWPAYTATVESDPIRKNLQVLAYIVLQERQKKNDDARACFLPTARGKDLDNWAANLGVKRLLISPAIPEKGIAAVYESDDDLLYRCQLAPSGYSTAGPADAYEFLARSASGQVLDAKVTSPEPGTVVVSVMARDGDGTPWPELLQTVTDYITVKTRRLLTDKVIVQAVVSRPFALAARLLFFAGPDSDVVLQAAKDSVAKYLAESRRIGRNITLSGLYAALKVPGVEDVLDLTPNATLVVSDTEAAYCTRVTITPGGVGE
ncbi:baseplate assembly protein [Dyella sp.]|uniref:baseplate assembly protein n=1 Tax=Dyella sp. TaxID=1869338 RepID=UPI002B462DA4|nr:baseplate J/gp47 family protein [Dyella sp.]HKT28804.1 baseplate J/gp47 family protein [Dyella sp.]